MTQLVRKGSLRETQTRKGMTFAETFMSVEAIIVCDVSGSMSARDVDGEGDPCSRHEEANRQLARLQARFPGRLAVVAFSNVAEFCPDGTLPPVQSSTNLYGALQFIAPADGVGIRIIVASDGLPDDEASALSLAKQMSSSIDTVYIGSDPKGKRFMEMLAKATKGRSITKGVDLLENSVIYLLDAAQD